MCGIAFGSKSFLEETFTVQSDRGMDGVGIVDRKMGIVKCYSHDDLAGFDYVKEVVEETKDGVWHFLDKDKEPKKFKTKEDFYTYYVENPTAFSGLSGEMFLLHHRKGSVGTKGIANVHPYKGKKFTLLQNGTDHMFHSWGILEDYDEDRSDSFMLLMFIEKHASTLEEAAAVLEKVNSKVKFGVVVLTDEHGRGLLYSDAERAMTISEKDGKLEWFRSKRSYLMGEQSCKGWLLFDFDGNILMDMLTEKNKTSIVKTKEVTYCYPQAGSGTGFNNPLDPFDGLEGFDHRVGYSKYSKKAKKKMEKPKNPAKFSWFYNDEKMKKGQAIVDELFWDNEEMVELISKIECSNVSKTFTAFEDFERETQLDELDEKVAEMRIVLRTRLYQAGLWSQHVDELVKQVDEYVEALESTLAPTI